MKRLYYLSLLSLLLAGCNQSTNEGGDPDDYSAVLRLGGDTTDLGASHSSHAFSAPASNLSAAHLESHLLGDAAFEFDFVAAPNAEHPERDGLGPAFNNTACVKCHQADGRGTPPMDQDGWQRLGSNESLFLRISVEDNETALCGESAQASAANNWCAPVAVAGFGLQLFHRGVVDLRTDSPYRGQVDVLYQYQSHEVTYADDDSVILRKPVFKLVSPWDAAAEDSDSPNPVSALLQPAVKLSPRIGPPVFGQGLLEAIREADVLALADADDVDGDGISGRANYVFDPLKSHQGDTRPVSLGRFGWKANNPHALAQSLGAFNHDMGITNYLFPEESIAGTTLFDDYAVATGLLSDNREVSDVIANAVTLYVQTLHVPARRNIEDPAVRRGAGLFHEVGCSDCHTPSFMTGEHEIAELSGQKIFPFTDMLLHDMGDGLADDRQDFLASGREWQTRPLWGIGLTKTVNPLAGFLHDGRARNLEEAILWHGGEAQASREGFRLLAKADRRALIAFLNSL